MTCLLGDAIIAVMKPAGADVRSFSANVFYDADLLSDDVNASEAQSPAGDGTFAGKRSFSRRSANARSAWFDSFAPGHDRPSHSDGSADSGPDYLAHLVSRIGARRAAKAGAS
jgi:hypothetical protein